MISPKEQMVKYLASDCINFQLCFRFLKCLVLQIVYHCLCHLHCFILKFLITQILSFFLRIQFQIVIHRFFHSFYFKLFKYHLINSKYFHCAYYSFYLISIIINYPLLIQNLFKLISFFHIPLMFIINFLHVLNRNLNFPIFCILNFSIKAMFSIKTQ